MERSKSENIILTFFFESLFVVEITFLGGLVTISLHSSRFWRDGGALRGWNFGMGKESTRAYVVPPGVTGNLRTIKMADLGSV